MPKPLNTVFALLTAALLSIAAAHATVRTDIGLPESRDGSHETSRPQVPVEKDVAPTRGRPVVPAGLKIGTFRPVPGCARSVRTDAAGTITELSWTGRIAPSEFQRFLFSAANPADPATLIFKVDRTDQDGTVVRWDDSAESAPASRITVR